MKKYIIALLLVGALAGTTVVAGPTKTIGRGHNSSNTRECSYSPLQEVIRDARSAADVQLLIQNNVNLNTPVKCGGTVGQLAVLRGNPEVLRTLLVNGLDPKQTVSVSGFDIKDAPSEIPLILFAGYYAAREEMISLLIQSGADVTATDSNGADLLWYINQNPVLRNTATSDEVKKQILIQSASGALLKESEDVSQMGAPVVNSNRPVSVNAPQQPIMTKQQDGSVSVGTPGSPMSADELNKYIAPSMLMQDEGSAFKPRN